MSKTTSESPKPTRRRKPPEPAAAPPAADAALAAATPQPLFVADIAARWRDLDAFNHVNDR